MKRRVLHCAFGGLGGHAAVLFTLLAERMRSQFEHAVLFFGSEELCDDHARECRRLGVPFHSVRKRGRLALESHGAVVKVIGEVQPDVVVVNGAALVLPLLVARSLLRARWAFVLRETQANHLKTRVEWLSSYAAARFGDAVIYLSPEYQHEVQQRISSASWRARAVVIPNGVDTHAFSAERTTRPEEVRLTMASRINAIKDHATLIDAIRLLRERGHQNLRLSLAGDGPLVPELQARVAAAGLQEVVTFEGLLDTGEVIALLRRSDIYVHCTYGETMSNSILQAMAAGLPIVASDVPGVSNLVRHEDEALLVPVKDASALADALERLLASTELREKLGSASRQRAVAEFSRDRMVDRYARLLAEIGSVAR